MTQHLPRPVLPRARDVVLDAVADAVAVVLPVRCAGCAAPDRSICRACADALAPRVASREVAGVPVWSSLDYTDVPRAVLLAYKDGGRVDAAAALARALRPALAAARDDAPAVPVLIPSTRSARRRRGYHPTGLVLARTRILPPPLWRALLLARQTADQAGLAVGERELNRAGSMVGSRRLRGRRCLVVDDIVTTGATIAEAVRAIRAAGGTVAGGVTIAQTTRLRS